MSSRLAPRLDEFERRLRELETELAELRALTAGTAPTASISTTLPASLEDLFERGEFRAFFRGTERSRREALANDDLDTLLALSEFVRIAEERAPDGDQVEAIRLGYAIRQNIRFVGRKLGVPVEEAVRTGPALEPEPRPQLSPSLVEPASPLFEFPDLSRIDLFGAKALAIAGGIVTALGIVFFFVLAVNRGWVGPEGRIGLGAFAALAAYGAGLVLRRRFGETYSSLAAVAAGIAGGYGVLLAAAQLYHFVGHAGALVIAAAIAGIGLVTALRWRSQLIAALGLLGATLAPLAVAIDDGLSVLGVAFVAFMAVATAVVAIRERWDVLLVLGALASLPQALALAMEARYAGHSPASVVALAAAFTAIAAGTGIARYLRDRTSGPGGLVIPFLFVGATFGVACALRLYGSSESRGFAVLALAIAFGAVAAAVYRVGAGRDLSALLGALGLVVGGIAFAKLMSGSPLAFAWAGEAATLAWLARRMREIRYQVFALLYFAAAAVHVLAFDATLRHLYRPLEIPAAGAMAVVALGIAAAVIAWQAGLRQAPRRGIFAPLYSELARNQRELRVTGWLLAALAAGYALSLGILAAFASFDWGHVAMFSAWSAIGLGVLVAGLVREWRLVRSSALAWLAVTLVAGFAVAEHLLGSHARGATLLIVGAALLAAAIAEQLLPRRQELTPVALGLLLAEIATGLAGFVALLGGSERGLAFLGLAALHGAIAVRLRSGRDFSTLLWGAALVLGYGASERLLPGTYHALALSIAAALLAWLSRRLGEPRLLAAAAAAVVVDVATAVVSLAPPDHLFRPAAHPWHGALATLFAALAAAAFAQVAGEDSELRRRVRSVGFWTAGVLAVYGLSIFILALFQVAFAGNVDANFHRGHTAVSAFWGLIGLGLLYFGLTRLRALRVAGFATFAVSLVKIFVFDLPSLSSITRALSFLAVGAVLLAGGFFYQRLSAKQTPQPDRPREPVVRPAGLSRADLLVALAAAAAMIVWFGTGSAPLG